MNNYKLKRLANGLPIISLPVPSMKTATILVMFKTGSKYEDRRTSGLSHFLEHMFFKGTEKYPDTLSLSSALDEIGAEYNAFTSKEYTGYFIKTASAKMPVAVNIIHELLEKSKFDATEIEREKGVIIEEFNMYQDNPLMLIEDILEECLYGDTPAGWSTIGTKKTIKSFKRQDFIDYFKRQYGSKSMYILLAGAWPKDLDRKLRQLFESVKRNKWQDKPLIKDKQNAPQVKVHYKKTDQVTLSLAVRAFPDGDPDESALGILSIILGGSMSSRLFINLRERQGLAYHVRTMTELSSDAGYLTTRAGVPLLKLEQSIKTILGEYKKISLEAVPAKELKKAKDFYVSHLTMQLESSDDIASFYGRQVIMPSPVVKPSEMIRKIKAVKAEDIKRVAKRIFISRHLNLALIGDIKNPARLKKILHF
ncbi:MAG: pitrilysin family protein [Patescibacteria group bacterium]